MKNQFLIMIGLILAVLLTGCCLSHEWQEATCMVPRTCVKCKKTEGEQLPHCWQEANCTFGKICAVCQTTAGDPLPHSWQEATWYEPMTCTVCGATEGTAKNFFAVNEIPVEDTMPSEMAIRLIKYDPPDPANAQKQEQIPGILRMELEYTETFSPINTDYLLFANFDSTIAFESEDPMDQLIQIGKTELQKTVDALYLFDLHTGKRIVTAPYSVNASYVSFPVELEQPAAVVVHTYYDAFQKGGVNPEEADLDLIPPCWARRFGLVVPQGYDGIVVAVPTLKYYNPEDTQWQAELESGEWDALSFRNYPEYYEDVTFYRLHVPEELIRKMEEFHANAS